MNVLFLSLLDFESIAERTIYTDLLREFVRGKHHVYVVSPSERRKGTETCLIYDDTFMEEREGFCQILKVRIGNTQKTNLIEKGISTLRMEGQCRQAIEKYFKNVSFDLVLYATPPITFAKVVEWIKQRDGAVAYLLLKDIFPQNAVDLHMFSKKGPFYWYFRHKEKKLYQVSDYIGCMSKANVSYLLTHNPGLKEEQVEICPNSIDFSEEQMKQAPALTRQEKLALREKYGLPADKVLFLYGGNLGKPQDISYIIRCLKRCQEEKRAFFIICGTGTEYGKLLEYQKRRAENLWLVNGLVKEEYDNLASVCDVGLIFLDHRFTIPNFPSRLLSYMEQGLAVLSATDANTDIGDVVESGGFGHACESDSEEKFYQLVERMVEAPERLQQMGENARKYLIEHYTVKDSCQTILRHLDEVEEGGTGQAALEQ